jgi:CheY-like chemotaxis protein
MHRGKYGRVLVAEGDAVNLRVVAHMLQMLGWEADIACDGNAALHLSQRNRYSLILMDCRLLKADGDSTSSKIREQEARIGQAHTPIVALIANAMPGDQELCLQSGIDGYITKPVQLNQLRETLNRWTGSPQESVLANS